MKKHNETPNPNHVFMWNVCKSDHASKRSNQRGFNDDLIFLAMDYGTAVFKQGLIYYVVTKKNLPDKLNHNTAEKLNNMVVVVSPKTNTVVTCWKSRNGIRQISKKPCRMAS